jgi:hypothetical protein
VSDLVTQTKRKAQIVSNNIEQYLKSQFNQKQLDNIRHEFNEQLSQVKTKEHAKLVQRQFEAELAKISDPNNIQKNT